MKPRNMVERFLLDDYGYGRLDEAMDYIRENKDELVSSEINRFFDGTILGTWKGRYQPKGRGRYSKFSPGYRPNPLPKISKFRTTEEALKDYEKRGKVHYSIKDIPYHLSSWNFWHGLKREQVEEYVEGLRNTMFPVSRLTFSKGNKQSKKWEFQLFSEKFAFYVSGSSASNTKTIIVDFDTRAEFVDGVNELVFEYYNLINPLNLKIQVDES